MGLVRGVARTAVVAGTATAVSNRVSRRQAGRWEQQADAQAYQEQQAAAAYQAQAAPPPPPSVSQEDKMSQLRELGELHSSGILTDAEFEVQKAKILSS